jgi:hypothetical protein
MKALTFALIAGGVCWIASEILELAVGGRTGLTLLLTAAFHLLMAGGIWAADAGQGTRKTALSRIAAGMASAGYLLLVYPPLAVARTPSAPYAEFMRARPLFMAAGMLVTVGVTMFGAAVLRSRAYPRWVGLVCLTSPLVFAGVMLLDGPALVGFLANTALGSAFVAMGVLARGRGGRGTT